MQYIWWEKDRNTLFFLLFSVYNAFHGGKELLGLVQITGNIPGIDDFQLIIFTCDNKAILAFELDGAFLMAFH